MGLMARTVCCRALVDSSKVPKAKNRWGEFLVCTEECKTYVEKANEAQMRKLMMTK